MSTIDKTRAQVREFLKLVTGDSTPEWRVCHSTDGTDEPTGVAPVCLDEGHDPDDSSVYDCCPDPVVEVDSGPFAAYLVELLKADRGQAAPAPDFFRPGATYSYAAWAFRCDTVTTHPATGERVALGWFRFRQSEWTTYSYDETDWSDGLWAEDTDGGTS